MRHSGDQRARRRIRWVLTILAAAMVFPLLIPVDAEAQVFGSMTGYRWNYVVRHMEFELVHSLSTDRVAIDDQGYIDLAMSNLHPMAIRDLFPYPWLYRNDQLREMGYSPILFWSIPYYLPSYDDMFRCYDLYGGFFNSWWGRVPWWWHWDRTWGGYYGRFPYDAYWGYWNYQFYFVDYPYGGWWLSGHEAMDTLSAQVDPAEVKLKGGWPVGLYVREPLPASLSAANLQETSVMEMLVTSGRWDGIALADKDDVVLTRMKDRQPRITRAYREFLPQPGPRDGRRSVSGDVSRGGSSGGGGFGASSSSGGGSKSKTKTKK